MNPKDLTQVLLVRQLAISWEHSLVVAQKEYVGGI